MFDDEPPVKRPVQDPPLGAPLDAMSIDELEARVLRLQGEITRCETVINAKRAHKSAADSVFGRRSS